MVAKGALARFDAEPVSLVVDIRQQGPYAFGLHPVRVIRPHRPARDYSVEGGDTPAY